ncbi:MAG: IPExxxVDY family protein [Cyclobacteriaceae bacterium]|nr:IPExxxVDY family protein [Cyclobacteriaceae bacterium]
MSKKKLLINIQYQFLIYGLSSALKEYKLAWEINNILDIHLVKKKDEKIELIDKADLFISNYLFETNTRKIRLLKNKSYGQHDSPAYLLPELNSIDYILLLFGYEEDDHFDQKSLKRSLQSISGVNFVQQFDPQVLKSRENLIF